MHRWLIDSSVRQTCSFCDFYLPSILSFFEKIKTLLAVLASTKKNTNYNFHFIGCHTTPHLVKKIFYKQDDITPRPHHPCPTLHDINMICSLICKQLVILLFHDKRKCWGFTLGEHIWAESFTRHKLQMGSSDLEQPITFPWPSDTFHLGK